MAIEATRPASGRSRGDAPGLGRRLANLWHEMKRRESRVGYLFILPSLVILGSFVFWPILQAFILSLQHWQFGNHPTTWVGLQNYQRLLTDKRAIGAFRNTLIYTVVTVPGGLLISLGLALALNERLPGRNILR